MFSVLLDM